MRPKTYDPKHTHVPTWWTWGGQWIGSTYYATWPKAQAYRRRAAKKVKT